MMDTEGALARCGELVSLARRKGADAADAVAHAGSSQNVTVRLGKLEDVERSESEEIGLRVFVGERSASISTSDFAAEGLALLGGIHRLAAVDRGADPRHRAFAGKRLAQAVLQHALVLGQGKLHGLVSSLGA